MNAPRTRTGNCSARRSTCRPSSARRSRIDHRADIYALGCVFFQLLCGRPPFDVSGVGELLAAHVYSAPPAPSELREGLSPGLDALVLRMLAKKPDDRFASMGDVVRALDAGGIEAEAPQAVAEATRRRLTPPAGIPLQRSASEAATIADSPRAGQPKPAPVTAPVPSTLPDATEPDEAAPRPTTTLGGIPQPAARRSSSLVMMGLAFVVTAGLALGAFFLLSRGGGGEPGTAASPTVTIAIDSQPTGAEVWRDTERLGTTPYKVVQAPTSGAQTFTLKKAGFLDRTLSLPGDRDLDRRVPLTKAP